MGIKSELRLSFYNSVRELMNSFLPIFTLSLILIIFSFTTQAVEVRNSIKSEEQTRTSELSQNQNTVSSSSPSSPSSSASTDLGDDWRQFSLQIDVPADTLANEISAKALDLATTQVARQLLVELVGDKNYQKNKKIFENKIIKQANKFIPFANSGQPQSLDAAASSAGSVSAASTASTAVVAGWRVPVQIKASIANLRQMLLQKGLWAESENGGGAAPAVLPMLSFSDKRTGEQKTWWVLREGKDRRLSEIESQVHEIAMRELGAQGFFLFRPRTSSWAMMLPATARREMIETREELKPWSQAFQTPLILRGEVRIQKTNSVEFHWRVIQASTGRVVAEIVRTAPSAINLIEKAQECAHEIAQQMTESLQKGTLNSQKILMSFHGPLKPDLITELKSQIKRASSEVRLVNERAMDASSIVLEIDYSDTNYLNLVQKIKNISFTSLNGKNLKLISSLVPLTLADDEENLTVNNRSNSPAPASTTSNEDTSSTNSLTGDNLENETGPTPMVASWDMR